MLEFEMIKNETIELTNKSGFPCTQEEINNMDILDFGLKNPRQEGAQILTLSQTDRLAVKLIALLPHQTLPEHWHVSVDGYQAKQEILRVVYGKLYIFFEKTDDETGLPVILPEESRQYYTCNAGREMNPAEQILINPPTPHWFSAGDDGCVVLCISTTAFDYKDLFTNPNVIR